MLRVVLQLLATLAQPHMAAGLSYIGFAHSLPATIASQERSTPQNLLFYRANRSFATLWQAEVAKGAIGASPSADAAPDASAAWSAGNYDLAITILIEQASQGDAAAMFRLGLIFHRGEQVRGDSKLGAYYLLLADRFGRADAQSIAEAALSTLSTADRQEVAQAVAQFTPTPKPAPKVELDPSTSNLLQAAVLDDLPLLQRALNAGANPNDKGGNGETGLMLAAIHDNIAITSALLQAGAKVNAVDSKGRTALHVAARYNATRVAAALLDAGAFAAAQTDAGAVPHDIAAAAGNQVLAASLETAFHSEITRIQEKLNDLGYEVGKADGIAGAKTQMQLAIFGNRFAMETVPGTQCDAPAKYGCTLTIPLHPHPTAPVLEWLFSRGLDSDWGINFTGEFLIEGKWETDRSTLEHDFGSKEEILAHACDRFTSAGKVRNCRIDIMVPAGSCTTVAWRYINVPYVSRIFADTPSAHEDALRQCGKRYKDCRDWIESFRQTSATYDRSDSYDSCVSAGDG